MWGVRSFIVGDGMELKCTAAEFSCVMALQNDGLYVHPKLEQSSRTLDKYFGGSAMNVRRKKLVSLLKKMCGRDGAEMGRDDPDDIVRIYILFVFNCVLFPTAHQYVPAFVVDYVDDLDKIGQYAWGEAVHDFLLVVVKKCCKGKRYADGCVFGLTSWFFERVPFVAKPVGRESVPRFARWRTTHPGIDECVEVLKNLRPVDVRKFFPLEEEYKYLGAVIQEVEVLTGDNSHTDRWGERVGEPRGLRKRRYQCTRDKRARKRKCVDGDAAQI